MRYLAVAVILMMSSCAHQTNLEQLSRYHEDGRSKPILALASMIDTTSFDASWSLSDEFTSMLENKIAKTGKIFVANQEEVPFTENPFGNDLTWMKREFHSQEFVTFLELVEHETVPASKEKRNLPPQEISSNLNMAVRVRVIDLRSIQPKVVLQETVRSSYFIPKSLFPVDYSRIAWGSDEYRKTPMGIAHTQIVNEIADRIVDYILLAKSR